MKGAAGAAAAGKNRQSFLKWFTPRFKSAQYQGISAAVTISGGDAEVVAATEGAATGRLLFFVVGLRQQ